MDGGFVGSGISKSAEGWPTGVQIRPPLPITKGTLLPRVSSIEVDHSAEIVEYSNNVVGTNVSIMICELIVAVTTVAPAGRGTRVIGTEGFPVDSSDLVAVVNTIPSSVLEAAEVGFGVGNVSGLVKLLDSGDMEVSRVPTLKRPVPKLEGAEESTPVPENEEVRF